MTIQASPKLGLDYMIADQGQGEVTNTQQVNVLDAICQGNILDLDLNGPPGGESDGDSYVPAAVATGDWTGLEENVVTYRQGQWQADPLKAGWAFWIVDEAKYKIWDGTIWLVIEAGASVAQENAYFVGKHGSDTNDGKSAAQAFLTFGKAITEINGEAPGPSATNRFAIFVVDAGVYTESFTLPEFACICALSATVSGSITVEDNTGVSLREIKNSSGWAFTHNDSGTAVINVGTITTTATGDGVLVSGGGTLNGRIGSIEGAAGVICLEAANGSFDLYVNNLYSVNGGVLIDLNSNGDTSKVTCNLMNAGANSIGVNVTVGSLDLITNELLSADVAYDIAVGAFLNLVAAKITGTEIKSGTVNKSLAGGNLQGNVYYVGKTGVDTNHGLSQESPLLTFGAAITLATAETPAANKRFTIDCLDAGIYTETFTLPQYVSLFAPSATITGKITFRDDCHVNIGHITNDGDDGAVHSGTGGESTLQFGRIEIASIGSAVIAFGGGLLHAFGHYLKSDLNRAVHANTGNINISVNDILVTGTAGGVGGSVAIRANDNMKVRAKVNKIESGSIGIAITGVGSAWMSIGELIAVNAYDVIAAGGILNLFVGSLTGTELKHVDATVNLTKAGAHSSHHESFALPPAAEATELLALVNGDGNSAPDLQPSYPVNVRCVMANGLGSEDVDVEITGVLANGEAATEVITCDSNGNHDGNKAWASISDIAYAGTWDSADITFVNGTKLGLSQLRASAVYKETFEGAPETLGTFNATNRTYIPTGALDGLKALEIWYTTG